MPVPPRPLLLCGCVLGLTTLAQMLRATSRCPLVLPAHSAPSRAPPSPPCEDTPLDGHEGCLQQALWGKCREAFLADRCNKSCGRCHSPARADALRRVLLLSARQPSACASADGDAWVMRALQNKADFARWHGMAIAWTSAQVDAQYDGAWNKLALLVRHMNRSLELRRKRPFLKGGRRDLTRVEWLLWMDWDVVVTDLSFTLPLEEYDAAGLHLVVGGEPKGVFDEADYLKLNTGVMLLRVHSWTLALLRRMLAIGRKAARRRHALDAQKVVKNLCVGCIDDQAALLMLLHHEPTRWRGATSLERRFMLQGYWEDFNGALPLSVTSRPPAVSTTRHGDEATVVFTPLRLADVPMLPPLRRAVFGHLNVPFAIHFAGCQLCSGKADVERTIQCWHSFRRTLRFAEDQSLLAIGLQHALPNRSEVYDMPLQPIASD
ncbi:hypothetical protein AB1Y20_019469 [Prymnesium parvum]|uniref:ShKT domain-containing protein n=1 Tax=Prymnesium parvum TaxID=97485 RepID=A0AB34JR86_PRYPA